MRFFSGKAQEDYEAQQADTSGNTLTIAGGVVHHNGGGTPLHLAANFTGLAGGVMYFEGQSVPAGGSFSEAGYHSPDGTLYTG